MTVKYLKDRLEHCKDLESWEIEEASELLDKLVYNNKQLFETIIELKDQLLREQLGDYLIDNFETYDFD